MDERLRYLLQKYKEQRCTALELQEFFEYINDHKHDQELHALLDQTFDELSEWNCTFPQKSDLWKRIHKSLPVRPYRKWLRIGRYAAAAVVLIIGGTLLYREVNSKVVEHVRVAESAPVAHSDNTVLLPDSTIVVLNKGAKLRYEDDYGRNDRVVHLEGEAYFSVRRDEDRPFRVKTNLGITTRVLGTKFNVSSADGNQVQVTVSEGKVQVESENKVIKVLEKNQQLTYSRPKLTFSAKPVDASMVVSWQNRDLYFNDITMDKIVARLAQKYQVSIRLQTQEMGMTKLSATFLQNESLTEILTTICAFLDAGYRIGEDGEVTIFELNN